MHARTEIYSQSSDSDSIYESDAANMNDSGSWKKIPKKNDIPEYSIYVAPIQKPSSDERLYRIVKLYNGIEVILSHDPDADRAAASMDVAVGYLSDPVSLSTSRLAGQADVIATSGVYDGCLLSTNRNFMDTPYDWSLLTIP